MSGVAVCCHNRRLAWLTGLIFGFLAIVLVSGKAQAQCVIYDKRDFLGSFRELTPNQSVHDLGVAWSDRTVSVRVSDNCQLVSWEDDYFEGDRRTFRENTSWVERYWTGRITSAQCRCATEQASNGGDGQQGGTDDDDGDDDDRDTGRSGGDDDDDDGSRSDDRDQDRTRAACRIYRDRNLRGASAGLRPNYQLRRLGRLDREVSSLSVSDGCTLRVFKEPNARGERRAFSSGKHARLARQWDDAIRSVQCACRRDRRSTDDDQNVRDRDDDDGDRADRDDDDDGQRSADNQACVIYTEENLEGRGYRLRDGREARIAGSALEGKVASARVAEGCRLSLTSSNNDRVSVRSTTARIGVFWQRRAARAQCDCGGQNSGRSDDGASSRDDDFDRDDDRDANNRTSDRDHACSLYEGGNFGGRSVTMKPGTGYRSLGRMDNRVSSVRVSDGCALELYENTRFNEDRTGFRTSYRTNVPQLSQRMDDKISSAKCRCSSSYREASERADDDNDNENGATRAMCALFEDRNLAGQSFSLRANAGFRDSGRDWSNRISSARVSNGCELTLYRERNYRGRERKVTPGSYNLDRAWNDAVRSGKCVCRTRTGGL